VLPAPSQPPESGHDEAVANKECAQAQQGNNDERQDHRLSGHRAQRHAHGDGTKPHRDARRPCPQRGTPHARHKPRYCRSGQEGPGGEEDPGDHIPALVGVPADGRKCQDEGGIGEGGEDHGVSGGGAGRYWMGAGRHTFTVVPVERRFDRQYIQGYTPETA